MAINLNRNKQLFDDFQLTYNNLASNLAPGLTKYEISVYLTKAYYAFVESLSNSYEINESSRKALIELTKDAHITESTTQTNHIVNNSKFFNLPDDVLQIVYESINLTGSADSCMNNKDIIILPTTHDQFINIYEDPFRFNKHRALRLDINDIGSGVRLAEIVIKLKPSDSNTTGTYNIRYIRKPKPIILEDLNNKTIDGESNEMTSELNSFYDKDIVKLAAQLAMQDYKAA